MAQSSQPSLDWLLSLLSGDASSSDLPPAVLRYMLTAPSVADGSGQAMVRQPQPGSGYQWPHPYAGMQTDARAQQAQPNYQDLENQLKVYRQNEANNYPRNEQDVAGRHMTLRPRGMVQQSDGSWTYPPAQMSFMDWLRGMGIGGMGTTQ